MADKNEGSAPSPLGLISNALGVVVGGLLGARQGRKDARIAAQRLERGVSSFDTGISTLQERIGMAEPFIKQLLNTAQAGLDEQRALVRDIGEYGFTQIADAFSRGAGAINRNFANRGFAGSTVHANAGRALASDVARGYSDLTSQLAGVRSQTVRAALGDLMNAQSSAANFHMGAGQSLSNLYAQRGQAILGVGHQPAQGVGAGYGLVGNFLGRALDEWIGSPSKPHPTGLLPGQAGPPVPPS